MSLENLFSTFTEEELANLIKLAKLESSPLNKAIKYALQHRERFSYTITDKSDIYYPEIGMYSEYNTADYEVFRHLTRMEILRDHHKFAFILYSPTYEDIYYIRGVLKGVPEIVELPGRALVITGKVVNNSNRAREFSELYSQLPDTIKCKLKSEDLRIGDYICYNLPWTYEKLLTVNKKPIDKYKILRIRLSKYKKLTIDIIKKEYELQFGKGKKIREILEELKRKDFEV